MASVMQTVPPEMQGVVNDQLNTIKTRHSEFISQISMEGGYTIDISYSDGKVIRTTGVSASNVQAVLSSVYFMAKNQKLLKEQYKNKLFLVGMSPIGNIYVVYCDVRIAKRQKFGDFFIHDENSLTYYPMEVVDEEENMDSFYLVKNPEGSILTDDDIKAMAS